MRRLSHAAETAAGPDESVSTAAIGCDRPQPIPGKIWVAHLCSFLFFVAYAGAVFTLPDRLRESLLVDQTPSIIPLDELASDTSRDPRNAILRGVRVESKDEKEARKNSFEGIHQVHPVQNPQRDQALKLFVFAPSALLPGDEASEAGVADLRTTNELTGMLRRPNPLAYRVGAVDDQIGIPHDAWLLHLDTQPYQPAETLLIGGFTLLLGAIALLAMMSQNWIPNRGLSFQLLFALSCLIGLPLRRNRGSWSMRMIFLVCGAALLAGGYACVQSGDRGIVIDAYWLEYWGAAIGMAMLGLAMVTRVAWVVCVREPDASFRQRASASAVEDERPVQKRSFTKFLVSLKTVLGGIGVVLIFAHVINDAAGKPIALLTAPVIQYSVFAILAAYPCIHLLLKLITRGFSEREYSPTERLPRGLIAYRQRHDDSLELARFENQGGYRVVGSAFSTTVEFHLGCDGMVIAGFISLSGQKAIELYSILESGICVLTASCKPPQGKQAVRWSANCYSQCGGMNNLEKLLHGHLRAVAVLAEQHDTAVALLTPDDVLDVVRYSNRAFHDMLFEHGETKDQVGPAQYGRFRFPTGISMPASIAVA